MNLSCKELKRQARETLNQRYGLPMGTYVASELIVLAITFPFRYVYQANPGDLQSVIYHLAVIIISLIATVLSCGLIRIHLDMARGKEKKFADLFYFFKTKPDRLILAQLLRMFLWFVLAIPGASCMICYFVFHSDIWIGLTVFFCVAGIAAICYVSLSFSLVFYFLADNETISVTAAFRLSMEHMKGSKGRLLYIWLSFTGMALLGLFSFGIGFLWVSPYMSQTVAVFYRNMIGEVS